MAKKETPQQALERWEGTLATLEAQRAEVQAKRAAALEKIREIEAAAKQPRSGGLRLTQYEALGGQAESAQRTIRLLDDQIDAVKTEVNRAHEAANHEKLVALRKAEKAQMEKLIAACDPFWAEIVALSEIHKQIAALRGHPLASVPANLWKLLEPGPAGGRIWWATTKAFQSFTYTADPAAD